MAELDTRYEFRWALPLTLINGLAPFAAVAFFVLFALKILGGPESTIAPQLSYQPDSQETPFTLELGDTWLAFEGEELEELKRTLSQQGTQVSRSFGENNLNVPSDVHGFRHESNAILTYFIVKLPPSSDFDDYVREYQDKLEWMRQTQGLVIAIEQTVVYGEFNCIESLANRSPMSIHSIVCQHPQSPKEAIQASLLSESSQPGTVDVSDIMQRWLHPQR